MVICTDNLGNAYDLNRLSAHGLELEIITRICALCDRHGIVVMAWWLPREYNTTYDTGSKLSDIALVRRAVGRECRVVTDCGPTTSSAATDGGRE